MERLERFYKIDRMLRARRAVTRGELQETLGISRATFKRDLEYMRDRMDYPIVWDRDLNAYRFDDTVADRERYQLPGLWFSPEEILALLTLEHMLRELQPGTLGSVTEPLRQRILKLMATGEHSAAEITHRIRILPMASRTVAPEHFQVLTSALLERRRLQIRYAGRARGETTEREVSPQRMIRYRDNWYLDAWCHLRQGLRVFAADAIEQAVLLDKEAREIRDDTLDRVLAAGYGIFSGSKTRKAVLQFSAHRARWVTKEVWHPEQNGSLQLDGTWLLEFPYSESPELVMDILKYGADITVLAPDELRDSVAAELRRAVAAYA
jgi:predicted DNA-binding transcriptional regulator YafY